MPSLNTLHNRSIAGKLLALLFGVVFFAKAYNDLSLVDNAYFVDLRNRIVGARLMDQNISPYFFKWDSTKPQTLYDPYDKCNIRNNMITSPPSVLLLMQPLADLMYTDICYWWIGLHYVFFLLIVIPLYARFKDQSSKALIIIVSCLFLLSDHWKDSVFRGQNHFVFPAVIALSLWLRSTRIQYRYLIIGLLFAFLIWTRPNALLIIPFLFLCKSIRKQQLFAGLAAGAIIVTGITFLLDHQLYWFDFYRTCKEWIWNNTSGLPMSVCNKFVTIEGKVVKFSADHPRVLWQSEVVDIYHFTKGQFKTTLPSIYLTISFATAYILAILYSLRRKVRRFSKALLLGILLYWFSEMTAPILKMSYYYIELFPVMLFLVGMHKSLLTREKILLIASMLFTFLHFIPMNLTDAEICTIACLTSWLVRRSHDTPAPY